ncbi:MAG: hypothetical protein JSV91_02770 [Phycisphaerales bacterium]|nr:MAG: hypothetical protein JSV91_02770 [Phycisphaerales bacterium]
MRSSAIASLGGVCLLLAAAAAFGATTNHAPSQDKTSGKTPPTATKTTQTASNCGNQVYRKYDTQGDKSQQARFADHPTDDHHRAYGLRHSDDHGPGSYFYYEKSGQQSVQRYDFEANYLTYGITSYHGAWYEKNRESQPQFQPEERRRVLHALMRLSETEREQLIRQLSTLNREQRQQMRRLFGIDDEPASFPVHSDYRQTGHGFDNRQKVQSPHFEPTDNSPAQRRPVADSRAFRTHAGNARFQQDEDRFLHQIAQALQYQAVDSLTAVEQAREHLTPQQRIAVFEPLLDDPSGSRQARNAAYLILIETYRDMNDVEKSMQLVQAMIAENQGFDFDY